MKTVSIIEFQMTVASLSVAEHALREEPYERLPYLAGTMEVAQFQMEQLRQEAMALRSQLERALAIINDAILHGMPVTEEVAEVSNLIRGIESGSGG